MSLGRKIQVDAIIVGGGLAGIHLALAMERTGRHGVVVDRADSHSASRIAAGIINPVTGRRFAFSWMYDRLLPVFSEVYPYWEQKWGVQFFSPKNIYRSVPHNKLINDLDIKLSDPAYAPYCRTMNPDEILRMKATLEFAEPGYVMHGFQLDTEGFLENAINYLKAKNRYVQGDIQALDDQLGATSFRFEQYQSEVMIWATGASIVQHPAFDWIQMKPSKGEVFIVEVPENSGTDIIKQSAFYVPLGKQKWWIGTFDTWEWDPRPTSSGREYLQSRISVFHQSCRVVEHIAAVRPAVDDRRPLLGAHPKNDQLHLFNGFGSKGTSLIPYFAKMMAEHLRDGTPLSAEVDVKRYWKEG